MTEQRKNGQNIPRGSGAGKEPHVIKMPLRLLDNFPKHPYYRLIRVPYWATFFKYACSHLSVSDYSQFLSFLWQQMEFPNMDENVKPYEFVRYFKKADKNMLMEADELLFYKTLPHEILVYRGFSEGGDVKALSWTLDVEKAKWFAKRFGKKPQVYSAKIQKKDVLAYFNGRGESELVLDYRRLYEIERICKYGN